MLRLRLAAAAALALSCSGPAHRTNLPEALRGLPPHKDPPMDLSDDQDLVRARAAFDAIPIGSDTRAQARADLWAEYQRRVQLGLGQDDRERAFRTFLQAISMWDPSELDKPDVAAPGLDVATELSTTIYRRFAATGNDIESATALAVLVAAHPERREEIDHSWQEIAEYSDALAIATTKSSTAAGFRPIEILESVTEYFPSRWAGEKLIDLYVARQQALQTAVQADAETPMLSYDRGARAPIFMIMRIYARLGRLDEAVPTVDKLAGQIGDWPDLRQALRDAVSPSGTPEQWLALAAIFVSSRDLPEEMVDWRAAYRVCLSANRRFPDAAQPPEMAARIVASVGRSAPFATRLAEEALALHDKAPPSKDKDKDKDKIQSREDVIELLARLYIARLSDLVTAERLDEARTRLAELEKFHDKVVKSRDHQPPKDKDIFVELMADAYQVMGFGLFAAGEITDSEAYVARAQKLKVTPQGLERLATIADKRGQHTQAAKLYLQSASLHLAPESTDSPMEQAMEEARLRRLAGEAWLAAGDKGQAETLWMRALEAWPEILGAMQERSDAAIAYGEIGRLRYYLGQRKEALQSFEKAVDMDPEAAGGYADIIAFLTTRGEYDAAHDAWVRALGRPEIGEYYKVYTSLWVVGLARVRGEHVDEAGIEFLGARTGKRWFHDLARFGAGTISYEELLARADTRGKRAEAMFYQAMSRYAAGDKTGAETLLHGVLSTEMFGFFEFDMARYFLDKGPPK